MRTTFIPTTILLIALCSAQNVTAAEPALVNAAFDAQFAAPDVSVIGAATLPEGERALVVSAGLPDVEVGWLVGLSSLADVQARIRFQYGRGVRVAGAGTTVGATFRLRLAESSGWNLALISDPEVTLHFFGKDHPPTRDTTSTMLALSPLAGGLVIDRLLHPDVRLAISCQTSVGMIISPEIVLHVPIIAGIGGEFRITEVLWLFTKFDTGADLYGPGGDPGSRAYLRARVGISLIN
jgi:hypothetical protein